MYYLVFLAGNALEMIWESRISARNSAELLRKGAKEIAPWIFPVMAFLYVLMYVGSFVEYTYMNRQITEWWSVSFCSLFVMAKLLKLWAVKSLGPCWTMKVLVVPGAEVVKSGPYRFIRHPNYIAVLMEIAATTLLGRAYGTFAAVFVLFSVVLRFRIRSEEAALAAHTDYAGKMTGLRRFVP